MGVPWRTLRPSVAWTVAALAVLALGSCGDDDARYVESPLGASWGVGAAGTDRDGTLVLTGQNRALTVPPGEVSGVVTGESFEQERGVANVLGHRSDLIHR